MFFCVIGKMNKKHGSGKTLLSLYRFIQLAYAFPNSPLYTNIELKNLPSFIMKRLVTFKLFSELEKALKSHMDVIVIVLLDEALRFFFREDTMMKAHKMRKKELYPFFRKMLTFVVFNVPSLSQLEQEIYDMCMTVEMPKVTKQNNLISSEIKQKGRKSIIRNIDNLYDCYESYEREYTSYYDELNYIAEKLRDDLDFKSFINGNPTKSALISEVSHKHHLSKDDAIYILDKYFHINKKRGVKHYAKKT